MIVVYLAQKTGKLGPLCVLEMDDCCLPGTENRSGKLGPLCVLEMDGCCLPGTVKRGNLRPEYGWLLFT